MRSFALPTTNFEIVRSQPGMHDGLHPGEPTGEIKCICCERKAHNIDDIPHDSECSQTDVKSRYRMSLLNQSD